MSEHSILVPTLREDLALMTFYVTKDFQSKFSLTAVQVLEAVKKSGVELNPDNQFMQASSFLLQSAFELYLDQHPGEIEPPTVI
jgi:hypothetical protein